MRFEVEDVGASSQTLNYTKPPESKEIKNMCKETQNLKKEIDDCLYSINEQKFSQIPDCFYPSQEKFVVEEKE